MKALNFAALANWFDGIFQYLAEPVGRIFGPDDDFYPAVGIQPYEGEPYSRIFED